MGEGAGLAVDVGTRAAVLADHSAQDAFVVIVELMVFQPLPGFGNAGHVESSGNIGAFGTMAYGASVGAPAHGKAEGVQDNGFAGTGLSGQRRHTLSKLKFDPLGNGVIGNSELCEHAEVLRSIPEYCDYIQ